MVDVQDGKSMCLRFSRCVIRTFVQLAEVNATQASVASSWHFILVVKQRGSNKIKAQRSFRYLQALMIISIDVCCFLLHGECRLVWYILAVSSLKASSMYSVKLRTESGKYIWNTYNNNKCGSIGIVKEAYKPQESSNGGTKQQ